MIIRIIFVCLHYQQGDIGHESHGSNVAGVSLLPGEQLAFVLKDLTYLCPYLGSISGKLVITNYKLSFHGQSPANKVYLAVGEKFY